MKTQKTDELINILKNNKELILNCPKNQKWGGLTEKHLLEIKKIPARYKRHIFIKSSIISLMIIISLIGLFSGYYFYYNQPKKHILNQNAAWNFEDYKIYEDFEDYDLKYVNKIEDTQYNTLSENKINIDDLIIDIDTQLQSMAQPLWQSNP